MGMLTRPKLIAPVQSERGMTTPVVQHDRHDSRGLWPRTGPNASRRFPEVAGRNQPRPRRHTPPSAVRAMIRPSASLSNASAVTPSREVRDVHGGDIVALAL